MSLINRKTAIASFLILIIGVLFGGYGIFFIYLDH